MSRTVLDQLTEAFGYLALFILAFPVLFIAADWLRSDTPGLSEAIQFVVGGSF